MKLTVSFPELDELLKVMGAPVITWRPESTLPEFEPIRTDLEAGVDVEIEEVHRVGGLLTYKGQQVLLYIRDNTKRDGVVENPENGNRFHVAYCRTLEDMHKNNRYERYVSTTRKDGIFTIDYATESGEVNTMDSPLRVCKNCLEFLRYKGYPTRRAEIWENFDLNEFFGMYSTFFPVRPTRTDATSIPENYVRNWSRISAMIRARKNWTCEDCGVRLEGESERKWLHAHHVSGVKTDNSMRNIQVLCIECHARRPGHEWIRVPEYAKRLLSAKRNARR